MKIFLLVTISLRLDVTCLCEFNLHNDNNCVLVNLEIFAVKNFSSSMASFITRKFPNLWYLTTKLNFNYLMLA